MEVSGTLEWGTPSKTSNGLPKSHLKNNRSKKVSRGPLPVANRPTGSSSSSPRALRRRSRHPGKAPQGRPRQGTPSPPRPRLSTEGLGRGCILRIARGVSREASARSPISVSREASFSVSLEAGSSAARHPPPRPTLQTARHVSLMLQPLPQSQPDDGSTPQNGRRDPRSHQRHTGRDRARRISAIPAGTGYGGDYRPLCPNAVPTISRPLKASALYTKVLAILGFVPAETPPLWCGLGADQASASRTVRP